MICVGGMLQPRPTRIACPVCRRNCIFVVNAFRLRMPRKETRTRRHTRVKAGDEGPPAAMSSFLATLPRPESFPRRLRARGETPASAGDGRSQSLRRPGVGQERSHARTLHHGKQTALRRPRPAVYPGKLPTSTATLIPCCRKVCARHRGRADLFRHP